MSFKQLLVFAVVFAVTSFGGLYYAYDRWVKPEPVTEVTMPGGAVAVLGAAGGDDEEGSTSRVVRDAYPAHVVRVVDGDTVIVDSAYGQQWVRLLGIDTPETGVCGSDDATRLVRQLVAGSHSRVMVVPDEASDFVDRFGRVLAYVELEDGRDVGEVLIREGRAWAWKPKYANYPTRFGDYQVIDGAAQRAATGSWHECAEVFGFRVEPIR